MSALTFGHTSIPAPNKLEALIGPDCASSQGFLIVVAALLPRSTTQSAVVNLRIIPDVE
jgi:hypothetical protein